ncbi:PTS sugar transporter subunit IIA [Oceanotoga sp. DSM 15011]|uniref:BglG family transcription antiterminator n=1 Tax=Oceanotoga sp. DSM 15011 TaxID=2984951 RepID=UPI0021F45345|nr:PTS sugar transporter subunit IIA [Oceanotoga sp. DSM 15011]UYP01228.1 PTS sugar transporter subunit IIA [Oceanotoga sp. DSM 15011]
MKIIKMMIETDEWVTANNLSYRLNVSKRSIKNYISEINDNIKDLIISSRKGYYIDSLKAKEFLDNMNIKIPQTPKDRINYIITRIIINDANKDKKTDLYEIADEIFVSYETIKKDMSKVRKKFKEFDLFILSANSFISIEGDELDKRKLLSSILYEEFSDNVNSLDIINRKFPNYDLNLLQNIIKNECKKFDYFINEYALLKLVLDIIISMDRIKKDKAFKGFREEKRRFGIREQKLAQSIADKIEKNFDIHYNSIEVEELTIILLSHLLKVDFKTLNRDNISDIVGEDCTKLVESIIDLLQKTYFIDIDDDDFFIKFTLHIKNLLLRLENGYKTKNPLLNHIKTTCPLIFEFAVQVADKLREITKYDIGEDEIAYIAFHIGGNLESKKANKKRVSCTVLFPQYYDFSNIMIEKLKKIFEDELEIKKVITSIDEVDKIEKSDLLISTVPIFENIPKNTVIITPFINYKDIDMIKEKIEKIKINKKKIRLKRHLVKISNPKFFYRNLEFKNDKEALRFMTKIMEEEGYIEKSYYNEILERENRASTAFGHIAVPHSMKMNAKKTGIFILLNEKYPINWNGQLVKIVLLFAINEYEREIFYDVYDNLIVLLLEEENAYKLTECVTYKQFIKEIIRLIK